MKVSTFLKAGALALTTLFISYQVAFAVAPPNIEVVSGNTTNTENTTGKWMFNRDISTSTPIEFKSGEYSIGSGSLYVKPIGANAADKFIGENFVNEKVTDVSSFSYDFKIAGNGDAADKDQFYMNVYANIDNSTNYYDCRFDYIPTSGSVSSFTTATITTSSTPVNVRKRGSRISSCPTTLAGMPKGSYVRSIAINLGDTTTSDVGLAGYFDNVVTTLKKTTIYDFEESNKVTICHRTNSVTNPYVTETVDADSVDGDTDNDNGKKDHTFHTGPVAISEIFAQSLKDSKTNWGDIIPPHHNYGGLNWDAEGQEVYNNSCHFPGEENPEEEPYCVDGETVYYSEEDEIPEGAEAGECEEETPMCEWNENLPANDPLCKEPTCEDRQDCVEPTPTPTPSPTPTPAPGKTSGLEITALSCTNRNFDVVIDLDDNNKPAAGVKVKFTYNGKVVESTTDAEGKARAGFAYEGDMSVKVEPENGFAGHSRHVELPKDLVCTPGVGGQVGSTGEVLGATTMAETGVVTDFLVKGMGSVGGMLTSIGSVLYAKKKRS